MTAQPDGEELFRNPIISGPNLLVGVWRQRQRAHGHTAVVLARRHGPPVTEWPQRPWTRSEDRTAGVTSWVEVDVGEHPLWWTCEPPCEGGAYSFALKVELVWSVHAPAEVVRRHLTDVPAALWRVLEKAIWEISRGFDVGDGDAAVEKINRDLGGEPKRLDFGVGYDQFFVKLRPHGTEVGFQRKRKDLQRQERLEREREQLLELERKRALAATRQELALRRERYGFVSELFRGAEGAIDPTLLRLLMVRLGEHADDTDYVIDVIRGESQVRKQTAVKALEAMLTADQLEPWQLQRIREAVVGLLEVQPAPVEGRGGATEPRGDLQALEGHEQPKVIERRSKRRPRPRPGLPSRQRDEEDEENEHDSTS